jgi:preprotein translocase subunit SecD
VELTLTTDGAARFDALARDVGTGGQIAVVVDGRVVSAPRLAGGPPPNKGVVTGLDEPTARGLADRLRP